MGDVGAGLVTLLTALAGFAAAVLGVLQYFKYRTRRDRIALIGTAFEAVVEALASDDEVKRMAAAIRLRRFFDPAAELAMGAPRWPRSRRDGRAELPYAADAVNVIVAILREQPPGNFQKLLADALTKAPAAALAGADVQRANLQNAWLGEVELPAADFYRADLAGASLKEANLDGAKFYEARLARTRLVRASLRGANFFGADLSGANLSGADLREASFDQARARQAVFAGARLAGADFGGADVRDADFSGTDLEGAGFDGARLDGAIFEGATNVPAAATAGGGAWMGARQVFLSQPAVLTMAQRVLVDRVVHAVEQGGAEVVRLERDDYPVSGSLEEVRRRLSGCAGLVVLGLPQLVVVEGTLRPGTPEQAELRDAALASPWHQLEAGMAIAMQLPVLVLGDHLSEAGIFAMAGDLSSVTVLELAGADAETVDKAMAEWLGTLSSY
jgi:uncharacterized protein YjbI with pentapeptide repeats